MTVKLKLTRLPLLNDTIVIKQEGGHYFIAAPDSFIIDKIGLLKILIELFKVGYLTENELEALYDFSIGWRKEKEYAENEENSSNTDIG